MTIDFRIRSIIAAAKTEEDFQKALCSGTRTVFSMTTNIMNMENMSMQAGAKDKKLFVHIDFAEGIAKDKYGIRFIKKCGADGIISTRSNIIKMAKECGLATVQRVFIIDSQSIDTAAESVRSSGADMLEVMPAVAVRAISQLKKYIAVPLIAGGLIQEQEDIKEAFRAGASAVSSGRASLWDLEVENWKL